MAILYCLIILLVSICIFLKYNKKTHKILESKSAKTMICIGSGGHTAEMMRILKKMNLEKYSPRVYVMADDDTTSEVKVAEFESNSDSTEKGSYSIVKIYRSRKVGQSYFGSIFTTLYAILTSVPVVCGFKPDVVLCNGPGTCIPICAIAYVMSILRYMDCKIVFVESVCRVKSVSLSGKILMFIADVFAVQWEELAKKYPKVQYFGKLS